ncbi:MAG: cytochrome b/b6 domain-containing protein [Xanthomonadales bacterium]|nr:cytochrome b/b6 domain-containing protein [Xanthomonadales bacterium]
MPRRWGSVASSSTGRSRLVRDRPAGRRPDHGRHESVAGQFKLYALHKSFGITVLALMLLRFSRRGIDPRPQDVAGMAPIVALAAHAVHRLLYVALLAMPISGWVYNSASNFPPQWFGR